MYKNFNKYIIRTPIFPVNYFFQLTRNEIVSDKELMNQFLNPIINEAIYLASPVLHKEINKWCINEIKDEKEKLKIKNSFLKYLSRLCSRSTPFGLFAGSRLGKFDGVNPGIKRDVNNKRHTRLDMNLTGILVKHLEKDSNIKNQLLYFPNTSLYVSGTQLRYVESNYNKGLLTHQIVEVENSEYLDKILFFAKVGMGINDIATTIVDAEISLEDAIEFVVELIDNQILISEMQQTVSGKENIDQILLILDKIKNVDNFKEDIKLIKDKLSLLDLNVGNDINHYIEISTILKTFGIVFDEKHAFQTDLILNAKSIDVNSDIEQKLYDCLILLNKISNTKEIINLNEFKNAFYGRYESREMPLSVVLDKEMGLGYPLRSNDGDVNPLLDDLYFNKQINSSQLIEWSSIHTILQKKVVNAIKEKSSVIEFTETEFKDFSVNWDNLPDTFSTLAQIVSINGNKKIVMDTVFGSSAGNLLGRFCHGDPEINDYVSEIIDFESRINADKIVAEIIHLPEDRLGNILIRPSFREYEIPYLSKSSKNTENQILIEDMLISIRNNKIVLKSKNKNLEIIPRLTTAHNFSNSSLPVYRFLCDMQYNSKRSYLRFDWGNIDNEFSYLPRVIYKDIILSTSKWKISTEKIKNLMMILDNYELIQATKKWIMDEKLPQYVYLVENDNKLLINLFNASALKMLFTEIKHKSIIILEEFLFIDDFICVDDKDEGYVNEFIFSFYNDKIA